MSATTAIGVSPGIAVAEQVNLLDHSGFENGAEGWSIQGTASLAIRRTSPGAGEFTAQAWRAAYRHVAEIAERANNPLLHNTVILMCWTSNPHSGRTLADFFPGQDVVSTLAWDCYNKAVDSYADPNTMLHRAIAASTAFGVDFAVAELGSKIRGDDDGTRRAAWLRRVAVFLSDHDAEFVTYFDSLMPGGDFRLLDPPSQAAWREVVAGSPSAAVSAAVQAVPSAASPHLWMS